MRVIYRLPFADSAELSTARPAGRYAHEAFPESRHAVDFRLPLGASVLASRGGRVVLAKHDSGRYISDMGEMERMDMEKLREFAERYTNAVCIDHGDGTFAEYLHLDNQAVVRAGQNVRRGQKIGRVGMTGLTTEPHLHFNVFRSEGGEAVSMPAEFYAYDRTAKLYVPVLQSQK